MLCQGICCEVITVVGHPNTYQDFTCQNCRWLAASDMCDKLILPLIYLDSGKLTCQD